MPTGPIDALAIDDHPWHAEWFAGLCEDLGYRVRRAGSMAEARAMIAGRDPRLLIVDLGLPDGRGADLIAEARAARPGLRIIAVSGDPLAAGRVAGADLTYVKGEFDGDQIRRDIRALLGRPRSDLPA